MRSVRRGNTALGRMPSLQLQDEEAHAKKGKTVDLPFLHDEHTNAVLPVS